MLVDADGQIAQDVFGEALLALDLLALHREVFGLVEFVELPAEVHPFYIGTQAHPELKSRPTRAHPLFAGLIGAALDLQKATRLLEVEPDGTVPELAEREDDQDQQD